MGRFMRLMVLFDLPVKKKADRKAYTQFRRFLIRDGYDMIQFSVYARICNGEEALEKHVKRLRQNAPSRGSVRYFQLTEKQFTEMKVLTGEKKPKEDPRFARQLTLF